MSHEPGKYLGGVRSVEDLRLRSRIDEESGCWLWGLATCEGHPRVWVLMPDGSRAKVTGSSAAVLLSTGKRPSNGLVAYRGCSQNLCVNPEHVKVGTRKQLGAHITKSEIFKGQLTRIAANTKNVRGRAATKLSLEKAREIRASPLTDKQLSALYGVPASQIGSIRRGAAWREGARNSSVFNQAA